MSGGDPLHNVWQRLAGIPTSRPPDFLTSSHPHFLTSLPIPLLAALTTSRKRTSRGLTSRTHPADARRIIRERRRQANFQLIVITHDEGFLQRLAAHDVLEYYW